MKLAFVLLLAATGACLAQDPSTNYYIERYPNDGIKQRVREVPPSKIGNGAGWNNLLIKGNSAPSTNAPSSVATNLATKAARYISPRVSSKEFAPSRLPEPKAETVWVPKATRKLPPGPSVSDKPGTGPLLRATGPGENSTNPPPSTAAPAK